MTKPVEEHDHENRTNTCYVENVPESESASLHVQSADEARTEITIRKRKLSTEKQNVEENKESNTDRDRKAKENQPRVEGINNIADTAAASSNSQQKQRLPAHSSIVNGIHFNAFNEAKGN